MGQVSAVEMAKAAGIDPKRFRQALRDEEFDWHIHGANWTVNRGGPDHLDMERVLRRLVSRFAYDPLESQIMDDQRILGRRRSRREGRLRLGFPRCHQGG